MREAKVSRETKETRVRASIGLDGSGECEISTGMPFFDHMLASLAMHGRLDLKVRAEGDAIEDGHHLVEDVGIVLGMVIRKAIGEQPLIRRFGHAIVPMDESCAMVALDIGGRGYLVFKGHLTGSTVAGIPGEMIEHFFYSLCTNAGITAHISHRGWNDHHRCEAIFKAFGIAFRDAVAQDRGKEAPSTKGMLY